MKIHTRWCHVTPLDHENPYKVQKKIWHMSHDTRRTLVRFFLLSDPTNKPLWNAVSKQERMIKNRKGCSKTGNDVLKQVNPRIKCVTQPKKFFFFFKQKSSLKLFFITHTFDSGGFFTFLLYLAHGAPCPKSSILST